MSTLMSNIQNLATLLTIWPDKYVPGDAHNAGEWFNQWLSAAMAKHGVDGRQKFIRALFANLRAHNESVNALPADMQFRRKAVQSCARAVVNSPVLNGIGWYDIMCEFPDLIAGSRGQVVDAASDVAGDAVRDDKTTSQVRMGPGVCTNMESLLRAVKAAIEHNNFAEVFDYIRAVGNECFSSMLKHVPAPAFMKLHNALIAAPGHANIAFTPHYIKSYLNTRMVAITYLYLSCGNAWHNLAESINGEKYTSPDENLRVSFYIRDGALKCEIMLPRGHVIYTAILVNNCDIKLYLH